MKKSLQKGLLLPLVLGAAGLVGCQSVTRIEYYEPTETNRAYCVATEDSVQGHGPIKAIEGKSGTPDFSDNKTFKFSLNVLGL